MDNEEKEYLRERKKYLMERRQKALTSPLYCCQQEGEYDHIQLLLDSGLCSKEQIECARESAQPYESTTATLIRTGKIDQLEFARICAVKAKVRFIDIPDHKYVNDSYGQRSAAFEWSQRLKGRATDHYLPMVPLPFYCHPRLIVVSDPLCIFELQEMVEGDATEEAQRPYRPCPWDNREVEYVSAPLEQINATIDAWWEWYLKRGWE